MDKFGFKVQKLREKKGWSVYSLAHGSGISESVIHKYEQNEVKNPKIESIIKLATKLETTVDYLINDNTTKEVKVVTDEKLFKIIDKLEILNDDQLALIARDINSLIHNDNNN